MKSLLVAGMVATVWIMTTSSSWASWGWPPPGYSTTGVKASDNSRYLGLWTKFRLKRQTRKAHRNAQSLSVVPQIGQPEAEPLPPPRMIED